MRNTAATSSPLLGRWKIVEMPDFDDDEYVNAEGQAFIRFDHDGMGEFHFGYVHGNMDYRLTERDGKPAAEWSWDGNDEHHPASGRGWAVLTDDGMLEGRIFYHQSDDFSFRAKKWPNGKGKPKGPKKMFFIANGKLREIRK
jgi:hypothetical protein